MDDPLNMQQPSESEMTGYFSDLRSRPVLVARTNAASQPYTPLVRTFTPITDSFIVTCWTTSLRAALLGVLASDAHKLEWTAFLPLRVHGKTGGWGNTEGRDMPEPEAGDFLLITVSRGTTDWQRGLSTALACRRILAEHGIDGMHVIVAEMDVVPLLGDSPPPRHPPPAPSLWSPSPPVSSTSSSSSSLLHLHKIFDVQFSRISPLYKNAITASVNEQALPFMPLPGQCVQPVQTTGRGDSPAGSLCCYLQLEDEMGTPQGPKYALTSRHVAVQDRYAHYCAYRFPRNEGSQGDANDNDNNSSNSSIRIAWGSYRQLEPRLFGLRRLKSELPRSIWPFKKAECMDELPERGVQALRLMEACRDSYLDRIISKLDAMCLQDNAGSRERLVGHVAFAAKHGLNKEGSWSDWALVALADGADNNTNTLFNTNHVYIGPWVNENVIRTASMSRGGTEPAPDFPLRDKLDEYGFLRLQPPHPPLQTVTHTTPRCVLKRGPMTDLTAGLLSPIEAVVRRPLSGTEVVAWAWPVLSFPGGKETGSDLHAFSLPGDSGSCVFDTDGTIIGMMDAGLGKNQEPQRLLAQHGGNSASASVPVPNTENTEYELPPQDNVPLGFAPWVAAGNTGTSGGEAKIDITFVTPMSWVLSEIEEVTGLVPRVL